MTMTQHTPGPWSQYTGQPRDIGIEYAKGAVVSANRLTAVAYAETRDECNANARLIAAAPDLLLHLERVTAWLTTLGGDKSLDPEIAGLCDDYADEARAATAKAKGE